MLKTNKNVDGATYFPQKTLSYTSISTLFQKRKMPDHSLQYYIQLKHQTHLLERQNRKSKKALDLYKYIWSKY